MCKKVVCFDLDDTLYKEIDFLKSGYKKVAELVGKRFNLDVWSIYDQLLQWYYKGDNAFVRLNEEYGIDNPIEDYLNVYRYHLPSIVLSEETKSILTKLKEEGTIIAIITDGREITQRQKIEALGLSEWVNNDFIFINEAKEYFKPNHWSFDWMMMHCYEQFPDSKLSFYYVGDNTDKDFIAPNELGWTSVCLLDNGKNIHKQDFSAEKIKLPKKSIRYFSELIDII